MTSPEHAKDRAEARRRNRLAAKERAEAEAMRAEGEPPQMPPDWKPTPEQQAIMDSHETDEEPDDAMS
jgi:hypothetical protein